MKTISRFLQSIWDRISDPRLRTPLMILAPCLALILVALALVPALRGNASRAGAPAPAPAPAAELQLPAAPEPQTEIPALPEEAEAVIVEEPAAEEPLFGWRDLDGVKFYQLEDGSYAVGLQEIDGKLYYFNKRGERASSIGIDVSFYDGSIDWTAVREHGVDFAIIRVGGRGWTSGAIYDDYRTQEYLREARAAGVQIGVYFCSTAVNPREAVEEAKRTLKAVDGIPLEYPIFIDLEFSGEYPKGRSDRLSPSELAEIAVAFCETVRSAGYEAGVYASQNYFKVSIDYPTVSGYTIWLASYTRDDKLPNFNKRYDIWQFTDRGRIRGISGPVDVNAVYG